MTAFAFGKNWQSFNRSFTTDRIDSAITDLKRIYGDDLSDNYFIDVGCGSGLSMLAAIRMGANYVYGMDADSDSVATARELLNAYALRKNWYIEIGSILNPHSVQLPVVYSWGVLHHTGNMQLAIKNAAAMVAPGGSLFITIYRKTPFCWLWKIEKRLYSLAPTFVQSIIKELYKLIVPAKPLPRGMSRDHDIHDWLGGYPYESAKPADVIRWLSELGFTVKHTDKPVPYWGLFGSLCNEYMAIKNDKRFI